MSGLRIWSEKGHFRNCPICLEKINEGQLCFTEECRHSFCFNCITKWSNEHNFCPICRQIFTIVIWINNLRFENDFKLQSIDNYESWYRKLVLNPRRDELKRKLYYEIDTREQLIADLFQRIQRQSQIITEMETNFSKIDNNQNQTNRLFEQILNDIWYSYLISKDSTVETYELAHDGPNGCDHYYEKIDTSFDGNEKTCPICQQTIGRGGISVINSCRHCFCHKCLSIWSKDHNYCPSCRQRFSIILWRNHLNSKNDFKVFVLKNKETVYRKLLDFKSNLLKQRLVEDINRRKDLMEELNLRINGEEEVIANIRTKILRIDSNNTQNNPLFELILAEEMDYFHQESIESDLAESVRSSSISQSNNSISSLNSSIFGAPSSSESYLD